MKLYKALLKLRGAFTFCNLGGWGSLKVHLSIFSRMEAANNRQIRFERKLGSTYPEMINGARYQGTRKMIFISHLK